MNKSELKKRILESLTPDEASKVDVKYKEIYAGMVGKNPLKMKKYDNPDKVAYGRAINLIKKESAKLSEKLGKDADLGDHIEDFQKSDAPQFKGKSKKKINQMAQAAFLNKEEIKISETADSDGSTDTSKIESLLGQVLDATKKLDKSQDDTEDDVEELDSSIDYLAAAITDRDPIDIAVDQATYGRLAKPTKEEKTLEEIDAMMEESAYEAGRKAKDAKDKSEKNYSNYFKKMDKNRLEEFVKEALKNPKKADLNKDGELSDYEKARATAIEKSIDKVDESFDSLVKKVDKSKGYTKGEAEKVAGSIAAKKRAGAGKGPTAKQKKRMAETILKELRGNVNEMAGEDLELKSLAKKIIPTLKRSGFEVEYSTDTSMKTLKNAGDKFVALRVQDGMLGAHIPFKAGLDAAKEIQKEIQKSLGNKFEYKLTKSKRGPGLEFYTILIRNK